MKLRTPAAKYHFMLGTTSRVPGHPGWHYLILDIDGELNQKVINSFIWENRLSAVFQKTDSGTHVYTSMQFSSINKMLLQAVKLGADRIWTKLARKRGWAFLADKSEVKIPWPVERMVLAWRKP